MERKRRWGGWRAALWITLLLALAQAAGGPAAQTAPVLGGDSPQLLLLFTGDVIGFLDPCG